MVEACMALETGNENLISNTTTGEPTPDMRQVQVEVEYNEGEERVEGNMPEMMWQEWDPIIHFDMKPRNSKRLVEASYEVTANDSSFLRTRHASSDHPHL